MKILMFGWEFPPFAYGGLGTACKGIVDGLQSQNNVHLTLVLPQAKTVKTSSLHIIPADALHQQNTNVEDETLKLLRVNSSLTPYISEETYEVLMKQEGRFSHQKSGSSQSIHAAYGKDLFEEIYRFAQKAHLIGKKIGHNLIHNHDWLTMPAAEAAQRVSGKPLISHIHATEFDRTGGNPDQRVYDIERKGMKKSDHIIAVSEFTKRKIMEHYGIAPEKISVVHNAVEKEKNYSNVKPRINPNDHVVLFLGRITLQKGPEYFVSMAKQVVQYEPNTKFVMAGNGDMMHRMIHLSAQMGIAKHLLFTGYLSGPEIDRAYQDADLYVMPSVSEPFGITPLEAIKNGTPVLISKQSGVSEVIQNALRVDFWDIEEMANKVVAVLRHKKLREALIRESQQELNHMSWEKQAQRIHHIYQQVIHAS